MISYGPNFFFPDSYAAPQYSPAEEERQARYERELERRLDWAEEFALSDLEPDVDPWDEECAA